MVESQEFQECMGLKAFLEKSVLTGLTVPKDRKV
jgi:hypothetical protein